MRLATRSKVVAGVFAAVLAVFLVYEPTSMAQVSTGSISGTLVDAQGAVIGGVELKLVNAQTNAAYHTVSDANGAFRFTLLPPGAYRMEASKEGFRKLDLATVPVKVGSDTGLGNLVLEIGTVNTSIEVTNAPPEIESTQAQISTTMTDATIAVFPGILENQGLDLLALTVPGVVNNRDLSNFANTNGVGFAVNGLRGRNNDQQVDGQNNNDNSIGGPALFVSDSEFASEYQITTSNFGAEYGRNSGSVVNVVTKSGTNNFHGSLYGTENNQRLDTLSNTQKAFEELTSVPVFNDLFVGGTIGGPIIKNKLFFFGGDNAEIINSSNVFATGLLTPTPAGIATLAACFPGSAGVAALEAYGPYAVKGGNPVQQGPAQTVTIGGCAGVEENGIQRALPTDSRQYNFVVKLDFQTAKNHFYGRYIYNKSIFYNNDPGGGGAASGYPFNVPALAQDYGFSWTRDISNHMANEFRASYGRENVGFGGNTLNTMPAPADLATALTNITFNDPTLLGFGPNNQFPQLRIVNTYQFQDNWTFYKGRHSLKAGINFTYQRSPNTFLPDYNGNYIYTDYGALGANTPFQIRFASGDPNFEFREKDTFLYFQDDFKLTRNLTLNVGLTWSYYTQPANLFHNNTVKNQTGSNPVWDPALPLSVTTFPYVPSPNDNWGPNVGFAWSPNTSLFTSGGGKTVLRGGFRMAYDPPYYNIYSNIAESAPILLSNTLTGSTAAGNPVPASPFGPQVRSALAPFLQTGIFDPRTFDNTSISPNFGPDKVYSWSFGVQQQVAKNSVLEVRYVGNAGRNLFQSVDANPYILGLVNDYPNLVPAGLTSCPASQAAVPEAVGTINCNQGVLLNRTNSAFSNYHALQTELRLNRVWNQLTLKSAYTFSKTLDNASEIFGNLAGGSTNSASQSQVNYTGQEYGLSGLDFPNNWVLTVIEELPFYRSQHGWLGRTLGGWAVSSVYTLSSGQPYTPSQVQLNCLSGGGSCDAPPTANNPYDTNFNAAFTLPDGALRPFVGSLAAPADSVGIYAADACTIYAVGCSLNATQLVSLNAINQGKTTPTLVTGNSVRYIANTATADQVFGTPFGTAGRNSLRDFHTNTLNLAIFKTVNISERYRFRFHADFTNALNHPNFGSVVGQGIDPFVDDAGLYHEFVGFANPHVQNGGTRNIRLGAKFFF